MDVDRIHGQIDRAIYSAFQGLLTAARMAGDAISALASPLPGDWHPAARYAVVLVGLFYALRFSRRVAGAPFSFGGYVLTASWLKFRSPFGRERWARWSDLRRAGLLTPGGLFLGRWRSLVRAADLSQHGEGHLLTIAGPGAGKTTGLVVPALLELRDGAVIVTDPKAQLAAMTARFRETVGPVVFINPFADDLAASTGQALPDTGFNPLSVLVPGYNLKDDADNLARLLLVTDRADSGSYWNEEASTVIAALLLWMVIREPEENRTLSFLWRIARESDEAFAQRLDWMASDPHPLLAAEGERLLSLSKVQAQWQGVLSKVTLATQRYAPGTPLGDHTARTGFDVARLKRENLTVYLMIPTGRAKVAAPWLNLLMGVFGLAVGRPGPARPVYMLMDEAPSLGYLPDLRNHLRETREAGLRVWIFSQTRAALADQALYGDNGFRDLMGLCDTKSFFSIGESDLAREISTLCGERTATTRSRGGGGKESVSLVGVPLIRPEAVLRLGRGRIVLVKKSVPPIRARLVPYWTRPAWLANTDRNPYRS